MCGIAGIVPRRREDPEALCGYSRDMARALHHRGPDASGTWIDEGGLVGLAHTRLSIIDVSPLGAQPMSSACERFVIVFNGEIYNFKELRREVARHREIRWRGTSDTEVLLECIATWGIEATLPKLNGMFALALWDRQDSSLSLARDRAGEKPLYYGWHGGNFFFSSELKALHSHPGFSPTIDRSAVGLFLEHRQIPAPHCIYVGLNKLPPASCVRLDRTAVSGRTLPRPTRYWSLDEAIAAAASTSPPQDLQALDHELEAALKRAVQLRMVADVPLGAFLSGGIDSSLVVALMQAQSSAPVKTFSVGFRESGFDEAPYARAVAQHLGTEHHEMEVSADDAIALIPALPRIFDEPFADASQIPTTLISAHASSTVTVCLSGDGGDELFAGYDRYRWAASGWRRVERTPRALKTLLARVLESKIVPESPPDAVVIGLRKIGIPDRWARADRLRRIADLLRTESLDSFYSRLLATGPSRDLDAILTTPRESRGHTAGREECGLVDRLLARDFESYLPDDVLTKVDRASMSVSLETRIPLLDPDVVEMAWRLPRPSAREREPKAPLTRLLFEHVPRELFDRPKHGFSVPVGRWLTGPLRAWAHDLLSPERLRVHNLFSTSEVQNLWLRHLAGTADATPLLWSLLMFQAWHEEWVEG